MTLALLAPCSLSFLGSQWSQITFSLFAENLEPHAAPLEIAHPEVGRYFTEFSDTHYIANEELETRYPEDMCKTHSIVEEFYHGLNPNSGQPPEPTANFQDHDLLDP